jgi:hypothetical protein
MSRSTMFCIEIHGFCARIIGFGLYQATFSNRMRPSAHTVS